MKLVLSLVVIAALIIAAISSQPVSATVGQESFPAIEIANGGIDETSSSSFVTNLPGGGLSSGDLAIVFVCSGLRANIPTGWTQITASTGAISIQCVTMARVADGTEGSTDRKSVV